MRHAIMAMLRRKWFRQGRARKRMHQLVLMHAAGASVLRAVVKCKKATRRMVLTLLRERRKGSRETDPNTTRTQPNTAGFAPSEKAWHNNFTLTHHFLIGVC